ncbi:MAG: toprim domain-containing protein [Enterovibrio sp.]
MIMLSAPLSCGHYVTDECSCAENAISATYVNHVELALATFRGSWRATLEGHGIKLPAHKKGGACPVCSDDPADDRFIFDDKDGRGTWHCRKCDVSAGGGLLLLSRCLGLSVVDTAKQLLAGSAGQVVVDNAAFERSAKAAALEAEKLAAEAANKARFIMQNTTKGQHTYLTDRGLHNAVDVYKGMIAVPVFKDKRLINVQLIGADRKKTFLKGGAVAGGYHVIKGGKSIAICEGYATALTVQAITGCTTFCAFSAGNLFAIAQKIREAFPDRRVTIFADRDQDCKRLGEGGAGVHYATIAAQSIDARLCIPDPTGDWDDVRQWIGKDACKAQMIKNIKTA